MDAEPNCPDFSDLERYLRGDEAEALVGHVSGCDSCAARLSQMRADEDLAAELRAASARPRSGARAQALPEIEGYDLEGEIHRGGQGIVYRAFQRSTKRTVAIKLLLDGTFASERQRLRFDREVELAASLVHPGIVAVHDSGVTRDGRSYFVMEYVDGVPANHYPGPRDPIDLAIEICEAVEAAHLRGVLHRDLKPGNILIDGDGQPHVLDFGLAAPTAPDEADGPRLTRTGEFMGTLAYTSPEHVTGDPNLLDVRSDVYALGVILYELFTGRLPYSVEGSTLDAVRAVAEAEPAPFRRGGAEQVVVDRELETVVLTALNKDKERRYPSAGALAADLRRYRDGQPLRARQDSLRYVLTRTLRRYRWRAAALAVIFFGAIGSSIAISILYDRVVDERDQVVRQSGRASEISEFFTGALLSISPNQARGRTVAVREVLDQASRRLQDEPPEFPEAELELRTSVGLAYRNLGLATAALPHLERAARLAEELYAPDDSALGMVLLYLGDVQLELAPLDRSTATYMDALAVFERAGDTLRRGYVENRLARVLLRAGELERARGHNRRSLELLEQGAAGDAAISIWLFDWASLCRELGDAERAEEGARESLERARAAGNVEFETYAHGLLGLVLGDRFRYSEARHELELALDGYERLFTKHHARTILCRTSLAGVLLRSEGRDAAAGLLEQCLLQRQRLVRDRDAFGAQALSNMGSLAQVTGDYALAEELQRDALEQFDAVFEQDTFYESFAQVNLAWTLYETSSLDEAEERAQAALAVRRRLFGQDGPRVARVLGLLGWIAAGQGRWSEAVERGREALAGLGSAAGREARVRALTDLGSFLYFVGGTAEALECFEQSLRLLQATGADPDARRARALHGLGEALRDSFRLDEAEPALREALELRRRFLGDSHPYTAQTMNALAMVLWFQQDPSNECLELLEEALAALRPLGPKHTYTAWVLNNLGAWHRVRNADPDGALALVEEGVEHARRTAAPNHPLLAINLANLALVHSLMGDHAAARPLLEESYGILRDVRGPADQQTAQVRGLLVAACEALGEGELAARYREGR